MLIALFKYIKEKLQKAAQSRMFILIAVFAILAFILIQKLFNLQIINGEDYLTNFTMSIKRSARSKAPEARSMTGMGKPWLTISWLIP